MGLFKKSSALEKVYELLGELTDEEKAELKAKFNEVDETSDNEPNEESTEETEAEQPVEETETEESVEETETPTEEQNAPETEDNNTPTETPTEETESVTEEKTEPVTEEDVEKVDEVAEAKDAKMEAFLEEWNIYKEKIDKLYDRLEEVDQPAESVGLGKQRDVEQGNDDEELSAYDYAIKNATY